MENTKHQKEQRGMKKAIGCLCYNEMGNKLYNNFQNSTYFIPTVAGFSH